jgi:hypothetical protein
MMNSSPAENVSPVKALDRPAICRGARTCGRGSSSGRGCVASFSKPIVAWI